MSGSLEILTGEGVGQNKSFNRAGQLVKKINKALLMRGTGDKTLGYVVNGPGSILVSGGMDFSLHLF